MFTCRYIRNLLNVYLLYIQPIIGLYLVSIGLWMFYAPDEQTCTEISIGLCTVSAGNDSNLLIVFYVQIMPDDFVMQLHRF